MSEIKVVIEHSYGECGHSDNGCSGWEEITIKAIAPDRVAIVSDSSCFGVSMEKLIEELLNKWSV